MCTYLMSKIISENKNAVEICGMNFKTIIIFGTFLMWSAIYIY